MIFLFFHCRRLSDIFDCDNIISVTLLGEITVFIFMSMGNIGEDYPHLITGGAMVDQV
jgi:hypothetical protein